MLSRFNFIKNAFNLGKPTNTLISNPNHGSCTRMYKVMSGTFTEPQSPIRPSTLEDKTESIQSDVSGFHKVTVVQTCPDQPQCHNRQCDTIHAAICPHQKKGPALVTELGGAMTHKIPANREGVLLDTYDSNGNPQLQYMVKEKTTVPVDIKTFKEHEKTTEYVQQENISKIIAANLSPNSTLALKQTSNNETPFDENL